MKIKLYLLLSILLTGELIYAQSPGGVSTTLKLWVKSNSGTSTTGGLVDSWTYANDGTKSFAGVTTGRPTLVANVINFNPSVRFNGVATTMNGPTGALAPITAANDTYTAFAVWQSNSTTTFQRVWAQRTATGAAADAFSFATWDASFPGPGVYGPEMGIPPFSQGTQRPYTAGVWNISQVNIQAEGVGDIQIIDDRNISTGFTSYNSGATRAIGNTVNQMGLNWDATGPLNGDIAELIVYDRVIDSSTVAKERNKIFSYLALKYGINIKMNLTSSAGTTIWANPGAYVNSIFGVGNDVGSGLSASTSNSIETGTGSGAGQSGKGNIVLSSPAPFTDQHFLVIGNDGGALAEQTTNDPPVAAGSKRLTRQWRSQNTGGITSVTLTMDFTGLVVSGGTNPSHYRLIVDADGNGDFTTGTVRFYVPTSFAGNIATFQNVALNSNEDFTFITSAAGGLLPVSWTDFTVKMVNNDAHLNWTIDNNSDADHYEIEHSTDGINYDKVGTDANIANVKSYSFIHRGLVSGNHFYRIKEVDITGQVTYSQVVNVSVKAPAFVMYLQSNPVHASYAEIGINTSVAGTATVELWSVAGTKISTQQELIGMGLNMVKVPMDRAQPGNYVLKVTMKETTQIVQVIKL